MDQNRLRQLAGVEKGSHEELEEITKSLELFEKFFPGKHGHLNIDTEAVSWQDIAGKLAAAKRGLGIASKMKKTHPEYAKPHVSRILGSLNTIRHAIDAKIAEVEQEWSDVM